MENTTPVSTRALLLVLKNIENNAKLDQKPPNAVKEKGVGGLWEVHDGVNWLLHLQEAQEGEPDQETLHAMQEA